MLKTSAEMAEIALELKVLVQRMAETALKILASLKPGKIRIFVWA